MSRGIRMSEQHGVNATVGICFWCEQEDGTLLLMGRLPGDVEAPKRVVSSYEPCARCAALFARGILLIEAQREPTQEGQPPMQVDPQPAYPTGRYHLVRREWVADAFQPPALAAEILRLGKSFIEAELFTLIAEAIAPVG
jgi:hypothetical protein